MVPEPGGVVGVGVPTARISEGERVYENRAAGGPLGVRLIGPAIEATRRASLGLRFAAWFLMDDALGNGDVQLAQRYAERRACRCRRPQRTSGSDGPGLQLGLHGLVTNAALLVGEDASSGDLMLPPVSFSLICPTGSVRVCQDRDSVGTPQTVLTRPHNPTRPGVQRPIRAGAFVMPLSAFAPRKGRSRVGAVSRRECGVLLEGIDDELPGCRLGGIEPSRRTSVTLTHGARSGEPLSRWNPVPAPPMSRPVAASRGLLCGVGFRVVLAGQLENVRPRPVRRRQPGDHLPTNPPGRAQVHDLAGIASPSADGRGTGVGEVHPAIGFAIEESGGDSRSLDPRGGAGSRIVSRNVDGRGRSQKTSASLLG